MASRRTSATHGNPACESLLHHAAEHEVGRSAGVTARADEDGDPLRRDGIAGVLRY
jgi:hypothetical protein